MDRFPVGESLLVVATTVAVTATWIVAARARAIEDQPGSRRLHRAATPRGGGVGIAAGLALAFLFAAAGRLGTVPDAGRWAGLGAGIGLFALVGLRDDLAPLGAGGKLAGQVAAATACAWFFPPADSPAGTHLLFSGLVMVGWVAAVNLWNFMDGSNGMVTLQAMLVAVTMAVWPGTSVALHWSALAVALACGAFLPFNFPKARVFLGDVGSHLLGASVFLVLGLALSERVLHWSQALLMTSVMWIDGGLTLLRRSWHRRRVWRAHREHLYQYAVRRGHSHGMVAVGYAAWTLVAIALAASPLAAAPAGSISLLFAVSILGMLCHHSLRRRWLRRPRREVGA